jgi:capsular exopolysaccharide synthesis family protein
MPVRDARPAHELYSSNHVDFRAFYYLLREKSWLIALCLVVAAVLTGAYLYRTPKIYAAKVVLQVEQEEQQVINIQRVQTEDLQSQEFLKTVEQTLQSRALLARVVATNKLAENPRFAPVDPATGRLPSTEALVSKLARLVEVKLRKGTRLIDIRVEHTDPELTELAARSLVQEYMRQNEEYNAHTSQTANEFLMEEAKALEQKLEASEQALQTYKEQMQSVSLEDRQNIVVQELRDLSVKATEAKTQRIIQEAVYRQLQQFGNDVIALLGLPAVANDPVVNEIRRDIGKQESEIANLRQRYREKHPKFIQALSELNNRKEALRAAVLSVRESVRSTYENARLAEDALEKELRAQESAALELNKLAIRYRVLERDVESDKALYQAVLNRIKETSVTKDLKPNKVRVVQPAVVPERPIKPDKMKVALMGLLAGLAAGVMLTLLLNFMDLTFKTVDQTEEFLALPVLSTIPRFSSDTGGERKLITAGAAHSCEAESFRTLRTALSMLGRKDERRTFLFTSAVPAEGKTFCSLNYGISLAQQGLRTLVIDCDLRRPMVEKTLMANNQRGFGLTDFLTGQKEFTDIVHATDIENFFFIPAGSEAPNPAELLAQTGVDGLLEQALVHFDRVIVDSAPIHAVSDTLLILNKIQTLCLVVRARQTPRNSVRRAVQILKEAEAPLAGVILNMIPRRRSGGYGYYYDSYYDYAYRGDYYAEKKKKAAA